MPPLILLIAIVALIPSASASTPRPPGEDPDMDAAEKAMTEDIRFRAFIEQLSDSELPEAAVAPGLPGVIKAIEHIARQPSRPSIDFARRLAAILQKHKVTLPAGLKEIPAGRGRAGPPDDAEMIMLARLGGQIIECFSDFDQPDDPDAPHPPDAVPPALRMDLLIALANHAPEGMTRIAAMDDLFHGLEPASDHPVSLQIASEAADAVLAYLLDVKDGKMSHDALASFAYAHRFAFLFRCVSIKAATFEPWTQRKADELIDRIRAQLTANAAAVKEPISAATVMTTCATHLDRFRDEIKRESFSLQLQLELIREGPKLLEGFLDAVNRNDRDAAKRFLTPRRAAALPETPLLEQAGHGKDVSAIKLARIENISLGAKEVTLEATLIITGKDGAQERRQEYAVSKLNGKWLLGAAAPLKMPD